MATVATRKSTIKTIYSKWKKKRNKKYMMRIYIWGSILLFMIFGVIITYFIGRTIYKNTFLPNTYINDLNVSGKTLLETEMLFDKLSNVNEVTIIKNNGDKSSIMLADFNYNYSTKQKIKTIYNKVNHNKWFLGLKQDYYFDDVPTYDKSKLRELLKKINWVNSKNINAKILLTDKGHIIKDAIQGDQMNYNVLEEYIISKLDKKELQIKAFDSGCYVLPDITSKDLQKRCNMLNNIFNIKITYDFDYTKEILSGKKLVDMITISDNGEIKANEDKVMGYVEYLAKKYDTYNKKRKFKSTLQGDIIIPTSDDAKYGWWIYQQATCDELVKMLEAGESVDNAEPIYFSVGNYTFTGMESARSANDDIGNTYIEIDLTNQKFWYYDKGKLKKTCNIVSGQTTSEARTTLPGVYKVWDKQTNYRMKDTNADGDKWDTTCSYWSRVAIVGIGLHDSQWRDSFGGNIYKYNGSHGCINMPLQYAKYVYENVALNTPVVMYY